MNSYRIPMCVVLALATYACGSYSDESSGPLPQVASSAAALSGPPVALIAIGSIAGTEHDLSSETAGALENGVAGNLLGGIGSGLAHAGGNKFLALPDRGPNAVPYNPAVDDTTSFIARFQTLRLKLKKSAAGAALPFDLAPQLKDTTLLFSGDPLVYASGGAPALNRKKKNYFTGRSDNFDPARPSTDPNDARLDPESLRVSNDGRSVFVSDEYGPYVYEFDRSSGKRTSAFTLPAEFAITHLNAQGALEISGNTSGRVTNKGMEGLAITPDGKTLLGAMQSPLLQDKGTDGRFTRLISIQIDGGATEQFAYELTNIGTVAKPKYPTVSDIVAINEHEFLVDERDGKGLGDNSTAVFKRIFRIDISGAVDVSGLSGEASLAGKAVAKTLFLDVVAELGAHGIASTDLPAKLEGLAFGPDVKTGPGMTQHTLFLANDNDFIATVTDSNHPMGIDNPNKFFVFGIDPAQFPGFEAQPLKADADDDAED